MDPPHPSSRPTLKRPQSLASLSGHDDQLEQSGRSPTGLYAHKSSASLASLARSFADARPSHSRPASLIHSRNPSTASSAKSSPRIPFGSPTEATPALQHTSSSDSNRTTQQDAASARSGKESGAAAIGGVAAATAIARASNLAPPPRIPATRGSLPSSRNSSLSLTRHDRPQTVRELGSDYTRYYNPFASRNSSSTSLAQTPVGSRSSTSLHEIHGARAGLIGGAATSTADRRPSNPFDDHKRLSAIAGDEPEEHDDNHREQSEALLPAAGLGLAASGYRGLDTEKSFFPYLDDRLGAPAADKAGYTFPLLWDEKEDDDDMHMPMVDDDKTFKATWRERFSRENIVSIAGATFLTLGVLTLFLILPVLSTTGIDIIHYPYDTPASEGPDPRGPAWARVNDRNYPLINNVRAGLIDPDTPQSAMTKKSKWDGAELQLVFSDEFNDQNRTFYQGDDPYFFGLDAWYGATQDLEWYDPDAITTNDGVLEIRMDKFRNHGLDYRSGMLNSWNQLCFKGGIWEVSVSLPAPAGVHGLWPGVWSMGNLGRPGYLSTTDGMWPYTYNTCDTGITPNQSMSDGTSKLPGQRLTSCTCPGSDHPTPDKGRGAPEIDIIEGAADWQFKGYSTATQSYQAAPFDVWYYPNYDYFMTPNYSLSWINSYTGGPFQQAISTTTMLNNKWHDGNEYQTYSYDYQPGTGKDAFIAWLVGDEIMGGFDGRALGPNGNIQDRPISEEPMSMIINSGISNAWTVIEWEKLIFPNVLRVDYVRLYQRPDQTSVTCDPPGYETTQYIRSHPKAYQNPNVTRWEQTGYQWPKNQLMHGC